MEKIKRRSIKTACSLLLSLLLVLSGMPLEGVGRVFAADIPDPTITNVKLQTVVDRGKKFGVIEVIGTNLYPEKRRIIYNTNDLETQYPNAEREENPSKIRIKFPLESGKFPKEETNTIQIYNKDKDKLGIVGAPITFTYQGDWPTIDTTNLNRIHYKGETLTVRGQNFKGDTDDTIKRKFVIRDEEIDISPASKEEFNVVLNSTQGRNLPIGFRVYFEKQGNVQVSYEYRVLDAIDLLDTMKIKDISSVPSSGPKSGGTILTITANRETDSKPYEFTDKTKAYLRMPEKDKQGRFREYPLIPIEIENKSSTELVVKTPKAPEGYKGERFYIVIKSDDSEDAAEAQSSETLFIYNDSEEKGVLSNIIPKKAEDAEQKRVLLTGTNILSLNSLGITNSANLIIKGNKAEVVTDPKTKLPVLKVEYEPKDNLKDDKEKPIYGGKEIKSLVRYIRVTIGDFAAPEAGEIHSKQPEGDKFHHYTTGSVDGVVFKTPNMVGKVLSGKQDVSMHITTSITLLLDKKNADDPSDDVTKDLPKIYTEGKLEKIFEYILSFQPPKVETIEPAYGYYNYLSAKKPLLVRIKGSNFNVIKKSDNTLEKPSLTARMADGSGEYKGEGTENLLKINVLKVLQGDQEVDGEILKTGDTIVAEILPSNSVHHSFANAVIKKRVTGGSGYKFAPVKFYIEQPEKKGNNQSSIIEESEKYLEMRYPTSREVQLQPTFEDAGTQLGVFIGSAPKEGLAKALVLNSEEESDILVKFRTGTAITDFNKVLVTIDGMDMSRRITKRDYDPIDGSPYIVLKTPKGIYGKTRLQVIVNEGLMDSYDLIFEPVNGPILEKLIPDNGQAGTWVTIKRDVKKNNVGFVVPPGSKVEEGSLVLLDGKKITKDVIVKDRDTILFRIPVDTPLGTRVVQVENPANTGTSQGLTFLVRDVHGDKIEIQSIDPNRGDQKGGIPTTITAKQGTNFSGGVDIYFGSQKAEIIGENLDSTKIFVKVPPFVEKILPAGESYAVPVTVQKKESGVTATVKDGFTYFNPTDGDKLKITEIYKKDVIPKTNTGNAGDEFWIEGTNFLLDLDPKDPKKVIYPDIFFGYERAEILEKYTPEEVKKDPRVARLLVRVPKPTSGLKSEAGAVDVMIINPNGATFTKNKGFIYTQGKPQILSKNLEASRFDGKVKIEAKDIFKDPYVIFGDKVDSLDLAKKEDLLLTTHSEIEKVLLKYRGLDVFPNFELYYQGPDGKNTLMSDATDGGKITLKNLGEKKLVKINWKNPDYHKNSNIAANKELMKRLHDEYMLLELVRDGRVNKLQVTRGLGKVDKYTLNPKDNVATLMVSTPYHEKIEKTKVTIVNTDGSSAEAPFTFNDSTGTIDITDIEGSSLRDVTVGGKSVKAKVKTRDVSAEGNIKILGSGFKDITSVKIGGKEVKVESLSPNGDFMIVTVPKGSEADVGKPLSIDIESKNGNVFSDEKEPPIYFMYIVAGSKPVIENLEPAEGPRTGGTRVKITGSGFREKDGVGLPGKIKLTVNGSAPIEIERFERDKQNEITALYAIMPKGETGKVKIQIINADEGTSDPKEFTYISQPVITKAGDAVFFNDAETEVTLTVEDLQEGAEVIIGAEMKKGLAKGEKKPQNVTAEGMLGVRNGENLTAYAIGGQKAKDVKVSKEKGTLSFKLPAGIEELEKMSVIIRNPDSGISEPKDNIIKPPIPDTPIIYAEPGAEGSVVLSWKVDLQALNAAEKFEVYAKLSSDSEYTFVGDTKQDTPDQAYIVKGLEHGTSYDFKVRVLNKYGEAKDLGYVRGFTLSASNDYKQQEKQAAADREIEKIQTEGKQEIVGTTLRYTVGTAQTAVDFTKNGKYKEKQLQIPVRDILTNRGKVLFVTDGKINLQLSHAALSVPELSKASEDAFLRVSFSQPEKKKEDALRSAIGRKSTRLSPIYKLDFELVEPKKTLKIKQLAGTISIGFPAGEAGYPAEYMDRNDRFERLSGTAISKGGYYVLLKDKNK